MAPFVNQDKCLPAVPAAYNITCRLNVNSVTQVYSISLSAFIVYAKYAKMSMENLNGCSQPHAY